MKKALLLILAMSVCSLAISQKTNLMTKADSSLTSNVIFDIDSNSYRTLKIGSQFWMIDNLKTTRFQNGDSIQTTISDISTEKNPQYQWVYQNNDTNLAVYGRLYTWHVAADKRNVCPIGWHVPSNAEWLTMTTFVYKKFKSLEDSGFLIVKGGRRDLDGFYYDIDLDGGWWGTKATYEVENSGGGLYFNGESVYVGYGVKNTGFSIRCTKNVPTLRKK